MSGLLDKANKYIQAEEYLETHKEHRGDNGQGQEKRAREDSPRSGRSSKRSRRDERRPKEMFDMKNLTPLNARPSQILHEIKDKEILERPEKMRSAPSQRDRNLWCHYHNDHGHTTDKCESLKRAIEALIKRGRLRGANETLVIEDLRDETKVERGKPAEDLFDIQLYLGNQEKTVRVWTGLSDDLKIKLVDLLRSYSDIFAWTASDMPGIDPEVLQDVETRYPRIDKVALALVTSARKLRPYFQSHAIVVLTDQPLGKVLQNHDASGRLVNWSVELGEFDIKYQPRTAIKAQALSDFFVECTIPEDPQQLILFEVSDPWLLYVDGSSKVGNSGAGLILISPEKFKIERFVIVAIDYFTKWTEAEPLATITASKCEEFFWKNVVCRFGVPKILITDNGKQFDNSNFRSFCEGLSISLRFTSVAHPQSNGQTENMNRSILQGLKRKLDDANEAWVDELSKTPKATVGKLSPNWEGPYKISKVLRPGAYSLETLSGEAIPRTWNADNLRQYYQ
ncbi:hypothetical protein RJ639_026540 [Escallonia herrerae]|uniref:Integrase catalytic domain-containing protein n=1 Tax=Escallonia herrerae TaxID=1293975 RepID=A0AA89ACD8_9ASTE|nr:hypothetical protein RJ639_026540 [Escallonia herrerae]